MSVDRAVYIALSERFSEGAVLFFSQGVKSKMRAVQICTCTVF